MLPPSVWATLFLRDARYGPPLLRFLSECSEHRASVTPGVPTVLVQMHCGTL